MWPCLGSPGFVHVVVGKRREEPRSLVSRCDPFQKIFKSRAALPNVVRPCCREAAALRGDRHAKRGGRRGCCCCWPRLLLAAAAVAWGPQALLLKQQRSEGNVAVERSRAATLRVAGAPEGCRFVAAGPNNVRQAQPGKCGLAG